MRTLKTYNKQIPKAPKNISDTYYFMADEYDLDIYTVFDLYDWYDENYILIRKEEGVEEGLSVTFVTLQSYDFFEPKECDVGYILETLNKDEDEEYYELVFGEGAEEIAKSKYPEHYI